MAEPGRIRGAGLGVPRTLLFDLRAQNGDRCVQPPDRVSFAYQCSLIWAGCSGYLVGAREPHHRAMCDKRNDDKQVGKENKGKFHSAIANAISDAPTIMARRMNAAPSRDGAVIVCGRA